MYVIVVGAGQVGYYTTKTLLSKGHEVTLVDWNYSRVMELERELGGNVLFASGSSIDGLEKAGCERADVIVAVTGDDEDNLISCQLGKRYFKVPKAIARITNPKNERIFRELGIGTTVSGTISISEEIERYVAKQSLKTLLTFGHDEMTLVELDIQAESVAKGKALKDMVLPYQCVVALVLRGRDVLFVKPETVFEEKDLVIAISTKLEQENLKKVFIGE